MSVLSGQRNRCSASEEKVWGCDAFTEEALSGWRSPPLPQLSAQTQTAPEEEEEERKKEGEHFSWFCFV